MNLHAGGEQHRHIGYWTAAWGRRRGIASRAARIVSLWANDAYSELVRIGLAEHPGRGAGAQAATSNSTRWRSGRL